MSSKLTRDERGASIQAVSWASNTIVGISGTADHTTAFSEGDTLVRIWADVNCFVAIGVGAVATTSSTPVTEKSAEYVRVDAGERISAITASGSGTLYITVCE